jgi:hypothetical protein
MKLYIPEIGDELILTKFWRFNLHAEDRNKSLAELHNHYLHYYNGFNWVDSTKLPPMRQPDYNINYPTEEEIAKSCKKLWGGIDYECYNRLYKEAQDKCPEYVKYWDDNEKHRQVANQIGVDKIPVTLPAGTILKVDRVYIRKNNSDYSSVTFISPNLGEVNINLRGGKTKKLTKIRFWARLSDINTIECEKLPLS